MQGIKDHEKPGKPDTTKGNNKALITGPKEMEIYGLYERVQNNPLKVVKETTRIHRHTIKHN